MINEVLLDIEDTKLLSAHRSYKKLLEYLSTKDKHDSDADIAQLAVVESRLQDSKEVIQEMLHRVKEAEDTLASTASEVVDETWIHGVTLFGITTHYKIQPDGTLLLRLEGSRDKLPLFEQVAVVHEIDLYPQWLPFCNTATMITKLSHSDLVLYFNIAAPMFSRDAALRCYGVDCLEEHGMVLLLGTAVDSWPDPEIPWKPRGWLHDRMIIKRLESVIKVTSPTSAKVVHAYYGLRFMIPL